MKYLFSRFIYGIFFYFISFVTLTQAFATEPSPGGVVFFTVKGVGSGHEKISEAIHTALIEATNDLEKRTGLSVYVRPDPVFLNDYLDESQKRIWGKTYIDFALNHPELHDFIFSWVSQFTSFRIRTLFASPYVSIPLALDLMKTSPRTIICANPLQTQMLEAMKLKGYLPPHVKIVKNIQSITDFVVTPIYFNRGLAIVPHPKIIQRFINIGKDPRFIRAVHGLPVRPEFLEPYDQQESRKKVTTLFDLSATQKAAIQDSSKKLVFISGGGEGIGLDEFLEFVPNWTPDVPVVVVMVTGNNGDALEKAKALVDGDKLSPNVVLIPFGFVNNGMSELQKASDFLIGKPGGSSTAEAIAIRKPMFSHMHLSAHENENYKFLTDIGVIGKLQLKELNDITAVLARGEEIRKAQIENFPHPERVPREIADIIIDDIVNGPDPTTEKFGMATTVFLKKGCTSLLSLAKKALPF